MSQMTRKAFYIKGMTCVQCERALREALIKVEGIESAAVNYKEGLAFVAYDTNLINQSQLEAIVEDAGYKLVSTVKSESQALKKKREAANLELFGILIGLAAFYLLINKYVGFSNIPEINASVGYGMLFFIGLLTSLHCVAMCGGINLSQCVVKIDNNVSQGRWQPSLLYNLGRIISYTLIGGIVGGIGATIGFDGSMKGLIAIVAGFFMIVMGINMLELLPVLKRISLSLPSSWRQVLMGKNNQRGPFVVGVLNGLMPCGPLQAMQLYALGTGSAITGAISMFFFSLGTVPLMLGFGFLATYMSRSFNKKMIKMSALLVILMGVVMTGRGFTLGGVNLMAGLDFNQSNYEAEQSSFSSTEVVATVANGVQTVTGEVTSRSYPVIVLEKNIPAKINFRASEGAINGCNSTLVIPEYNLELALKPGDNIIEFTPNKSGVISYSCWMGMVSSEIKVKE